MSTVDVVVRSDVDLSVRARQVCGMFDCPPEKKQERRWSLSAPLDEKPWNIGLIVGPSGAGKTTIAKKMFPATGNEPLTWDASTLIDCFDKSNSIEDISATLSSVGFSTIPAWIRPYRVLSNGERFRAEMARILLESKESPIVVDEFTSTVDRQVGKIVSHCVQKYVRRHDKKFVAVSCHEDIKDWLQPDWVIEPHLESFHWRSVQRRPPLQIEIARVQHSTWDVFAPFHYMTNQLHRSAQCFALWCNGSLAAFAGVIYRSTKGTRHRKIAAVSRLVTLPDFQGLGLAFVLSETLGAAYTSLGCRFRNYPAHPSFVRAYRTATWRLLKKQGVFTSSRGANIHTRSEPRPCAVLEYRGKIMEKDAAQNLIHPPKKES